MSVTYHNFYSDIGLDDGSDDARWSNECGFRWNDWIRTEMRFNGRWHRPPVGIKAEQCTHVWVATIKLRGEEVLGIGEKLVPR